MEKLRFTFRGEVKLCCHFSVAVLDVAVIEALVLLAGLHDGQGHSGVVACTEVGDSNVYHRSELAFF